jgi:hypothetical protein
VWCMFMPHEDEQQPFSALCVEDQHTYHVPHLLHHNLTDLIAQHHCVLHNAFNR